MPGLVKSVAQARLLCAASLVLLGAGCGRVGPPACPLGAAPVKRAEEPTSHAEASVYSRYFPKTLLDSDDISQFAASWWVGKLRDFHEPSLLERAKDRATHEYRVMTLPSLVVTGDSVITIRQRGGGATLESKRSILCEDHLGDGLATLVEKRQVDAETWRELAACMDHAFWHAPPRDGVGGDDGVTTVIEGVRDGEYHFAHRWSLDYSEREPARLELLKCLTLLEAAAGWVGWYATPAKPPPPNPALKQTKAAARTHA